MLKEYITAGEVAQYIIELKQETNNPPSHLALQKLLYFVQRDWMGANKVPLFDDDFHAWQFGPVIPGIYYEYRVYGAEPIWAIFRNPVHLPREVESFIIKRLPEYAVPSAWDLVHATHNAGTAWTRVWRDGVGRNNVIPKRLILEEAEANNERRENR